MSPTIRFAEVDWAQVPDELGVYVIFDLDEVVYVGMAGRNGKGSLRRRLRDHSTGQVVNMFAQYLYLARVQFVSTAPLTRPREATLACRDYIRSRCAFRFHVTASADEARALERALRTDLSPAFNPA